MPDTRRTTSARENGAHDQQEPPKSTSRDLACQEGAKRTLAVPLDGREIFLPPLIPRRVYQITFQGTSTYWRQYGYIFKTPKKRTDAVYEADEVGNFVRKHDWLSFNGQPLPDRLREYGASPQEDREAHRYTFRISGRAEKVSVRFCVAGESQSGVRADAALTLVVELLPEGTPSPFSHWERKWIALKVSREMAATEEKANLEKKAARGRIRLAEQAAQERAQLMEQAANERTALQNKLAALQCRAHREDYFLDPDFQQRYARHHLKEILSKLKAEWAREYDALMQEPQLKQLAEKQAPEVLQWHEAKVNIVRLAEQMSAPPPLPAPPPPPERKERTAEEVRVLKVRKDETQARDLIARAKMKAEMLLKAAAELDSIPLDPEELETLKTELVQKILDIGEEEENNGKHGTTL